MNKHIYLGECCTSLSNIMYTLYNNNTELLNKILNDDIGNRIIDSIAFIMENYKGMKEQCFNNVCDAVIIILKFDSDREKYLNIAERLIEKGVKETIKKILKNMTKGLSPLSCSCC